MDTAVTREEALLVYAYCMLVMSRDSKKHMRLSKTAITITQDKIYPVWQYLTESERLSFLYRLSERKHLDTKYVGPVWKLAVGVFWLKDKCADLAADFILSSDKRLN